MKQRFFAASGFILLAGVAVQGIFGLAAGLLVCCIAGFCIGRYRKDPKIWKPSLLLLLVDILCIIAFWIALSNCGM